MCMRAPRTLIFPSKFPNTWPLFSSFPSFLKHRLPSLLSRSSSSELFCSCSSNSMAIMLRESRPACLAPGLVFDPDIDDLRYYLNLLTKNPTEFQSPFIRVSDVYSEHPDQLTGRFWSNAAKREWFFFTKITVNHADKGKRTWASRAVGQAGTYWRASQEPKPILDGNGEVVGSKRSFEYMIKGPDGGKGDKTDWRMEEFQLDNSGEQGEEKSDNKVDQWVICRIYVSPRALPRSSSSCESSMSSLIPREQSGSTSCDKGNGIVEADDGDVMDEIKPL